MESSAGSFFNDHGRKCQTGQSNNRFRDHWIPANQQMNRCTKMQHQCAIVVLAVDEGRFLRTFCNVISSQTIGGGIRIVGTREVNYGWKMNLKCSSRIRAS
jgi:hypothetical protein